MRKFLKPILERGQLELPIAREIVQDRNADKGGRSFYFFDFDDNVMFLSTPSFIFHKVTGEELQLSSGEFAQVHRTIGHSGPYKDYRVDLDDGWGTFRCFRDKDLTSVERWLGRRQAFVQDLAAALGLPDLEWKGPSWSCFYHATLNRRPVSVITARGHHPDTIRTGIKLMVHRSYLPHEPNYLSIYPVSHPEIRKKLNVHEPTASVAFLKKKAIRSSVEQALRVYGYSPYHRFGMSDDDPHNVELIVEEMTQLKGEFPEMSFFVIDTKNGHMVKREVFADHTEDTLCAIDSKIDAFEQLSLKV